MNKDDEPTTASTHCDSDERELNEAMDDDLETVSLWILTSDLANLKAKATREGVPYKTLINSILHKAAIS